MASCDNILDHKKKKHSCRRVTSTRSNLDTSSTPVYCRRRNLRSKHTIRAHDVQRNEMDGMTKDGLNGLEGEVGISRKSPKCERERRRKTSEDSTSQNQLVEEESISEKRKNKLLSKDALRIANEYHKLEKHYKTVQEECKTLSNLLEQREVECRKICSHYEALVQMAQELDRTKTDLVKRNQKLETEKLQYAEDIKLLKNIVYQLNTELERYQDKLREQKCESVSTNIANNDESYNERAWDGINFHALGPLLNAYQEDLSEKRSLIQMYEQEMADFSSRCKEILAENELMHKEVKDLTSEGDRYKKEIKALVENTTSLKKQNDQFKKEAIEIKKETSEIRSSCELKIDIVLKRNETLKKENESLVSELSNLRGKYEILSKEFEQMKSKDEQTVPTAVHNSAIEECKTLLDELKHRYETEKRNLCNHIKRIEESQPENEKQFILVVAERNHLKNLVERLEANLNRTQRKIERMQNQVHSTRISRNSLKEQLSKATAYCGELFSEYERMVTEREKLLALLRKTEKENANMDRLGKSISSRMEGLKHQFEIVQKGAKQQVDSVEKRIKLQELQVRRMKREYRCKIQHLNDVIKQKEELIEKLEKEKRSDENNTAKENERSKNP